MVGRGWNRKTWVFLAAMSMVMTVVVQTGLGLGVPDARAARGAYMLDFAAADPGEYIPPIPFPGGPSCPTGTGTDPILDAHFTDPVSGADVRVESLAPEDMALGQIVPFEIRIDVDGDTSPEDGAITFAAGWNIDTTSNDDFGYDEDFGVRCAFVDRGDGAHVDPDGEATVGGFTWTVVGDEIQGSFDVTGLDDGDVVVVEVWLVLEDTIPAGVTGNVQSRLISAATADGDTINTGNQTVPLLRVQEFFTADADVSVAKSDSPDPVTAGGSLTYTLVVANAGPAIANGVVVTDTLDPNTTYVSATADNGGACSETGGVVTCELGAIVPGMAVTVTIVVDVATSAPTAGDGGDGPCDGSEDLCNRVVVASLTDDPEPANNTDSEPTDVIAPEPEPAISVEKTADQAEVFAPGEEVTFTVVVTNDSAATDPVTITSLTDSVHGDLNGQGDCAVPQTIQPGNSHTCSFTALVEGTETNVVSASGADDEGTPVSASDDATVGMVNPSIDIEKSTNGVDADQAPGPDVLVGSTVEWTYVVVNTGDVALTGIAVTDDQGVSVSCPADTLQPGGTMTCEASGVAVSGQYANTGTATGTATDADVDTTLVSDEDDSHYIGRTPAIDLEKVFTDDEVTAGGPASSFELRVTNTGDIALTEVAVTDTVDARLTVTGVDCDGTSGDVSQTVSCSFDSLVPGATALVTVTFEVAAGVVGGAPALIGNTEPVATTTCRPEYELNRDGVCTSPSIRPIASCWEPDGTQVIEIVNIRSKTIGVWWDYLGQSGRVSAAQGSTFFTLTGGPSSGELRVRWSYDQAWYIDITDEPCGPSSVTVDNTATVTAVSAVGDVEDEDSDTVVVVAEEPNEPPSAAFTSECVALGCSFTDQSTDADGSVVAWEWDLGDGATSTQQNPLHDYAAPGTYPVTLTVTDDEGATSTVTQEVTVRRATMHVGDIDSIAVSLGTIWDAFVYVTILDEFGDPVVGAVLDGSWGKLGTGTCVSDINGLCSIVRRSLRVSAARFIVTDVSHATLVYDPSANTDPDGDSDGTSIGLRRP